MSASSSASTEKQSPGASATSCQTGDEPDSKVRRISYGTDSESCISIGSDSESTPVQAFPSAADYYIALGKHLAFGAEWPYASFPSPATPRYLCQNTHSYYVKQEGLCSINYYDPSKYRHQ